MSSSDPEPGVLLVLGVSMRSGTNFLSDLICLHSRCAPARGIWEDYMLSQAHLLDEYVDKVSGTWKSRWAAAPAARLALRAALSTACLDWIRSLADPARLEGAAYVVSKTPSVENLSRITAFPQAAVVVVVRDGRAVTESAVRSFDVSFDEAALRWAAGVDRIVAAREQGASFLLVRYEDLMLNLRVEVGKILEHLGLDASEYDFAGADSLPVRGSSTFGRQGRAVRWAPTEKTADFRPLERFRSWDAARHARFLEIVGSRLARMGYGDQSD